MTFDGGLALFGIFIAALAAIVAWQRPEAVRAEYLKIVNELRTELAEANKRIEDLQLEYRKLATEYLRIIGENHWLRLQLRSHNPPIDIPPLPKDLQPQMDSQGNITIHVSGTGGVQMSGGSMSVAQDLFGGNKKENK